DAQVLAVDETLIGETTAQPVQDGRQVVGRAAVQEAHDFYAARLRARRQRRRDGRRAEEGAPLHSITSSARARKVGGRVMPSAAAVLRLTIISKRLACCTGMSAVGTPFRS